MVNSIEYPEYAEYTEYIINGPLYVNSSLT